MLTHHFNASSVDSTSSNPNNGTCSTSTISRSSSEKYDPRSVLDMLSWKNGCHFIIFLFAFFCFLPQILGYSLILDPYTDDNFLQYSNQYHTSLVVSISITTIILIENILDNIIVRFYTRKDGDTSNTVTYFKFPMELLLLILGKDLVLILYVIPNQAYNLLPGLLWGQDILFIWSYLYNFYRLGKPIWTLSKVFAISLIFGILDIMVCWTSMSDQAANDTNLFIIMQTLAAIAFFMLFVVTGQWIVYVWKKTKESTDILTSLQLIQASVFIFFFLLYVLFDWWAIFYPTSNFNGAMPEEWNTYGVTYLTTITYIMTGCTACVSIITGRVSRLSALILSNMSEALSVRKMFMRYISHEMRTPLNTVSMGLNVLMKQFQNVFHLATDHLCYLTAKDIQGSCNVAIEILNDMLLYDKIESGLLALELVNFSPWLDIKQSVELFYIQVNISFI